jgi:aryl-alcohol dehydrogenase-like predicted oxidoreductase
MKTRRLGKTGFEVSEIGLGCWQLGGDFGPVGDETADAILTHAHNAGVTFWDTADVYGGGLSESRIGVHAKGPDVVIATKLGRGGGLYPNGYTWRSSIACRPQSCATAPYSAGWTSCRPRAWCETGAPVSKPSRKD